MSKPPMKKAAPSKRSAPAKAKAIPAPAVNALPDEMKWKAQDALSTLKRAHEIKGDAKLMEHVRQHAHHERAAISKVIGRGVKKA